MKRVLYIFLLLVIIIPIKVNALSEDEARKVLTDYANYVYNNQKDKISYTSPSDVNQQQIFKGYYTKQNTYAMDCNAFMGFLIYNAFQINATDNGTIPQPSKGDGVLTSTGRPALNNNDGWSTHSSYYNSKSYNLRGGETIQNAVSRIGLENLLKPGDLIGVVGFNSGSYPNQETSQKSTHIMMYLGNGKYIHNKSSGVSIDSLDSISFGNRVGSIFPDSRGNSGPHGAITVLKLQNYESLPNSLIGSYRFPNGNGELSINNDSNNKNGNNNNNNGQAISKGHWEEVTGLHFCEREDTYRIVLLINTFLIIIQAVVPTLLLISIFYEIYLTIIEKKEIKDTFRQSILKTIAAIIAVIIPSFISYVVSLTPLNVTYEQCVEMAKNPKPTKVWIEEKIENDNNKESVTGNENELQVKKQGPYITLTSKNVTGYYFSNTKETLNINDSKWISSNKDTIDFVLLPGKYYVYAKTQNGNIHEQEINVSTSDIIITNNASDIKLLTTDLASFLSANGSSLNELNDAIARSVYIAGPNTKEGAAAAALSLTQILYINYKIKIPYGTTHGGHIVMGAPSVWGSSDVSSNEKSRGFYYQGIHCGGFISWAYTQAGFSMNSGIGSSAQICGWGYGKLYSISPNAPGNIGDVMTTASSCDKSKHVAILTAVDSGGYFVTEANAKTSSDNGVVTLKEDIGIVTTYNPYGTRWSTYLDMAPTINTKRNNTSLNSGF